MFGAVGSFTLMAIAGRAVSLELDTFEIMTYRSLVGIGIVVSVAAASGSLGQVRARRMGLHGIRNLSHFAGQNLWFYAITVLPLAQVFALEFTMPVWAIVLTPLILGDRLSRKSLIAAGIGFAGILIVAHPGSAPLSPGLIAAATCAVGFALSGLFTRKLTRTENITSILFWLTVMQAVFGLVCAGYDGDIALPSLSGTPWVLVISCAGLLAHFCLTTALSLAPPATVLPIDFARLPLIAVVGALFYSEALDPMVFAGGAVIILGNWLNLRWQTR
jgi:drug/metabolite transporter (DMT)-like permease